MITSSNLIYKPLSLGANTFFVSDLHYGHDREFLWGKRGFKSVQDHDVTMIDKWNACDGIETSNVFHLGDIMFGSGGIERLPALLNQLHFKTLFLMGGNHHAGFKQLFERAVDFHVNLDGRDIYFLPNYFEIYIQKQPIVLSHYPIGSWNGQSKGSWQVHGHSHGSYSLSTGKQIDVGIEVFGGPVPFETIKRYMNKRPISVVDHHDSKTNNPF